MLHKALLLASALALTLAATPAEAQRGGGGHHDRGGDHRGGGDHGRGGGDHGRGGGWGGGDRNGHRGGGWNGSHHDGWGNNDHRWRDNDNWRLSLSFGSLFAPYGYGSYSPGYYHGQPSWNAWGLGPYECRWDREFGYWYNRPADVEVKRCADAYGDVYIVQGSHRLWGYR